MHIYIYHTVAYTKSITWEKPHPFSFFNMTQLHATMPLAKLLVKNIHETINTNNVNLETERNINLPSSFSILSTSGTPILTSWHNCLWWFNIIVKAIETVIFNKFLKCFQLSFLLMSILDNYKSTVCTELSQIFILHILNYIILIRKYYYYYWISCL